MNALLEIAVSNLIVAAALAVFAGLAGWWGRHPALTHSLWLLVLVKLVTPPLAYLPIPLAAPEEEAAALPPTPADEPPAALAQPIELPAAIPPPVIDVELPPAEVAAIPAEVPDDHAVVVPVAEQVPDPPPPPEAAIAAAPWPWRAALVGVWLTGSLCWFGLALARLRQFHRLLRHARQADADLCARVADLADALGVPTPQTWLVPGCLSPMLWVMARRSRLLVPEGLLGRLSADQLTTLLAHELAHWKRRDHRVRWLEFVVLGLWWWCPLAWLARRELRQAEEECCDAWVVAVLPGAARDYALALVETIDFLSGAPTALPPVASGIGHVRLLKRRLTMILRGTTPCTLTRPGLLVVAAVGVAMLPFLPVLAQAPPAQGDPNQKHIELELDLKGLRIDHDHLFVQGLDKDALKEIQRAQAELARLQDQIEQQRQKLQKRIDDLRKAADAHKAKGVFKVEVKPSGQPAGVAPGVRVVPVDEKVLKVLVTGKHGTQSVDQRLDQLERKMDAMLWELQQMRQGMAKGPHTQPAGQQWQFFVPGAGPMGPMGGAAPMKKAFTPVPPMPPGGGAGGGGPGFPFPGGPGGGVGAPPAPGLRTGGSPQPRDPVPAGGATVPAPKDD